MVAVILVSDDVDVAATYTGLVQGGMVALATMAH